MKFDQRIKDNEIDKCSSKELEEFEKTESDNSSSSGSSSEKSIDS